LGGNKNIGDIGAISPFWLLFVPYTALRSIYRSHIKTSPLNLASGTARFVVDACTWAILFVFFIVVGINTSIITKISQLLA
jgi:hypothetical protein